MHKDQGGGFVELQGIKCYLPKRPPLHEIQGSHLPKKDQVWYPTPLPSFKASEIEVFSGTKYKPNQIVTWDEACREEEIKNSGYDPWNLDKNNRPCQVKGVDADLSYRMPVLSKFRKQELNRIKNGHWVMINGEPTYFTGIAYVYFNWWKMDIGLPDYRRYIRELLYVVEVVRTSPIILGLILASMRGIGKSYLATCILYVITIFTRDAFSGMQSKSDDDCQNLFSLKLCEPMTKLPNFLVPLHSWKNEPPKGQLDFSQSVRQHPNFEYDKFLRESAIRSVIDHRRAKDNAYDSETTTVLLQDEIGKIDKRIGSVLNRFDIIRFCVQRGSNKRGIIFGFTTVGNMEKGGGHEFRTLYEQSDQTKTNELGYTHTGMVNYFISALEATVFDKYGNPVIDKPRDKDTRKFIEDTQGPQYVNGSRAYHDAQRKTLFDEGMGKGDLSGYINYCQQNPYTLQDAFTFSGKECIFNADILKTVQFKISSIPQDKLVRMGNFEWDVKDKSVKFVENRMNPRCFVSMMPDGNVWIPNTVGSFINHEGKKFFFPKNERFASAGFDPFSHKDVVDKNKASKAALTLRTRYNFHFPDEFCEVPIVHYKFRTYDPEESFEDILKICFFFSIPVLIENVKGGQSAINYFERRGYGKFVMSRPSSTFTRKDNAQDTPGMPMATGIVEQGCNLAGTDIVRNAHKWKHIDIIEDSLEFNPKDTQKFDSFMSYMLSLIAAEKQVAPETKTFSLDGLLPTYNIQKDA